jgi:hypothetical protein
MTEAFFLGLLVSHLVKVFLAFDGTLIHKNPAPYPMLNVMNPTMSHFLNHTLREQRGETFKIREREGQI